MEIIQHIIWIIPLFILSIILIFYLSPILRMRSFQNKVTRVKKFCTFLETIRRLDPKQVTLLEKLILEEIQDELLELEYYKNFEPSFWWSKKQINQLEIMQSEIREYYQTMRIKERELNNS